jgi:NADPH:quinone reductase-like Zn-dependent oxidoreductase
MLFHKMPFNYVPAKNLLDEKIVLITGSTGGIGTALSMKCAELGATVIICGRSIAKLEKLYQSIFELGLKEPLISCRLSWYKKRRFSNPYEKNRKGIRQIGWSCVECIAFRKSKFT